MLNTDFGLINQILPGDPIPWLTDATLARFSLLMVNLWLGFPYFLLVCSGALTAIPADLKEAAYVDGAGGLHAFRTVVLPLLLISTAPLLVTTFAFNFNNYTLDRAAHRWWSIRGARSSTAATTDLLINYTLPEGLQRLQPATGPGLGHLVGDLRHRRDGLGLRVPVDQEA